MRTKILKTLVGKGKTSVECIGVPLNGSMIFCVMGLQHPHVGAVALGMPRPSLKNPNKLSATSSVLTVIGHKEDELVKAFSLRTARKLGLTTLVVAGLHIDKASRQDIKSLEKNAHIALEKLLKSI